MSYSEKRAKKDRKDRDRAIEKMRKKVSQHRSPAAFLSNHGYKKYLKISGQSTVELDQDKIDQASKWDGLLGVCTNVTQVSKPSRIRAHLAIAFTSFCLVKFMAHRVWLQYKQMSPEAICQTLIRVQSSIIRDTDKNIRYVLPSKFSQDAKKIYNIFSVHRSITPSILKKL